MAGDSVANTSKKRMLIALWPSQPKYAIPMPSELQEGDD